MAIVPFLILLSQNKPSKKEIFLKYRPCKRTYLDMFFKEGVLKSFAKFRGKHTY